MSYNIVFLFLIVLI